MQYKFFLYRSDAGRKGAYSISIVNRNLRFNFPKWDKDNMPEKDMLSFDTKRVAEQIKAELPLSMNEWTEVSERQTPEKKTGYLCVETYMQCVELVWPSLTKIALQEQLVLLDAQTNKYVFEPFPYRFAWRDMTQRILELNEQIRHKIEGVWRVRRLYKQHHEDLPEAAYVISLIKSREHTLQERTEAFFHMLQSMLVGKEKIHCGDRCFTIKGGWYTISYVIEAYRKSPNMLCYIDNGVPRVELLHRISCEKAFKWLKYNPGKIHHENHERTIERIPFTEMEYKYPNPADRFCASVNITKALIKEKIRIDYSSFECTGLDYVMIHRIPYENCLILDSDDCRERISALRMGKEVASFILPFFEERYPYINDRYYQANHIPAEMLREIKDRIAEMRTLLYTGEKLEVLEQYLEKADFYALDYSDKCDPREKSPAGRKEIIRERRLEIAHMYDIFIRWAEAQLEYCCTNDDMFNIIGP